MFDALDFASLDAFPDNTLKVEALGADLWFAGTAGWEVWYDAGNKDFPFRRRPNGIIKRPVGRMKSIAQGNEQLFWWSFDNRVYATAGYQEQRISTHAIERVIADAYEVSIAQCVLLRPARAHLLLPHPARHDAGLRHRDQGLAQPQQRLRWQRAVASVVCRAEPWASRCSVTLQRLGGC